VGQQLTLVTSSAEGGQSVQYFFAARLVRLDRHPVLLPPALAVLLEQQIAKPSRAVALQPARTGNACCFQAARYIVGAASRRR
jgi:hypothetical protein